MHEQGLCRQLLRQVLAIAQQQRAHRISSVNVCLGPWSMVADEQLQHAFPTVCAGTIAAGATLNIERHAARIRCLDCATESTADAGTLICPHCQSRRTQILNGDEILITHIEVCSDHD